MNKKNIYKATYIIAKIAFVCSILLSSSLLAVVFLFASGISYANLPKPQTK